MWRRLDSVLIFSELNTQGKCCFSRQSRPRMRNILAQSPSLRILGESWHSAREGPLQNSAILAMLAQDLSLQHLFLKRAQNSLTLMRRPWESMMRATTARSLRSRLTNFTMRWKMFEWMFLPNFCLFSSGVSFFYLRGVRLASPAPQEPPTLLAGSQERYSGWEAWSPAVELSISSGRGGEDSKGGQAVGSRKQIGGEVRQQVWNGWACRRGSCGYGVQIWVGNWNMRTKYIIIFENLMIIYSGFTRPSPHLPTTTLAGSLLRPYAAPRPRPPPLPPLPLTRRLPSLFFYILQTFLTIFQSGFLLNNVLVGAGPLGPVFPSLSQRPLAHCSPFYRTQAGKNYVIEFFYNSFSMGSLRVSSLPCPSYYRQNTPNLYPALPLDLLTFQHPLFGGLGLEFVAYSFWMRQKIGE